jgi:hypothetical protein
MHDLQHHVFNSHHAAQCAYFEVAIGFGLPSCCILANLFAPLSREPIDSARQQGRFPSYEVRCWIAVDGSISEPLNGTVGCHDRVCSVRRVRPWSLRLRSSATMYHLRLRICNLVNGMRRLILLGYRHCGALLPTQHLPQSWHS